MFHHGLLKTRGFIFYIEKKKKKKKKKKNPRLKKFVARNTVLVNIKM